MLDVVGEYRANGGLFDPFAIAGRADQYAAMAAFRSRGGYAFGVPPYPELDKAIYVLTSGLIHKALKHPALLQAPPGSYEQIRQSLTQHTVWAALSQSVLMADPPRHLAMRGPMNAVFSRRNINSLEIWLQDQADALMVRCLSAGRFDITRDFAVPFAVGALSRILGLPIDDPHKLKRLTAPVSHALELRRDEVSDAADTACLELIEMIEDGIRRRFNGDAPYLIDAMEDLVARGEWSRDDLIGNCVLFYFAGQETVVDSLGSQVLALDRYPAQRDLLKAHPDLLERAVEELLRYEPPVHYAGSRIAACATTLGEISLAPGDAVVPVLAAGNRDPSVYPDPERLDITRKPASHVSFGTGIHICLGIHLARLELKVALRTLYHRLPNWRLADAAPIPRQGVLFRGYTSVPAVAT